MPVNIEAEELRALIRAEVRAALDERWLSVEEAAERLGMNAPALYKRLSRGRLEGLPVGVEIKRIGARGLRVRIGDAKKRGATRKAAA